MNSLKEKLPGIPLHSEVDAIYINYNKRQNIAYYDFYIVYYSESSSDLYFARVKHDDEEMINLADKDEIINYLVQHYKEK